MTGDDPKQAHGRSSSEEPGLADRLLSGLSSVADWTALAVMERLWLSGGPLHTESALERQKRAFEVYSVADPVAFFPEPGGARVEARPLAPLAGGRIERWRWRSSYRTHDPSYQAAFDAFEENRVAHAEAWRHEGGGAPAVVCLHPWLTGSFALARQEFAASKLYHAGLDVVLVTLPFHGPRTPRDARFSGQLFPGTSFQLTNEAFGQTVWDVRALVRWLRESGSGPVGVMGMSLGGYASAVLASVERELSFSIPIVPIVSLADLIWEHGRGHEQRRAAEERGVTLERFRELYRVHSPLELRPLVPRERRLIVAGRGDLVTDPAHVEKLWEHWERPRIHWFPGSHIVPFGRGRMFDVVIDFLNGILPGTYLKPGPEGRTLEFLRKNVGPISIFIPSRPPAAERAPPAVVLVPGFGCASGAMEPVARYLESRGHRCVVPSLGGLFGILQTEGVASAGERLARYLRELPPGTRPWIVGHSLGGLIAREAVQHGGAHDRVAGVATIATPHRGTPAALAALGLAWLSRAPRDMLPWSRVLRGLNGEPWPEGMPLLSIVSRSDALCIHPFGLVPFADGRSVRSIVLEGLGHTEMLGHRTVFEILESSLRARRSVGEV
jgi:pimeloyl-ACP methyl ester carboxylesterase